MTDARSNVRSATTGRRRGRSRRARRPVRRNRFSSAIWRSSSAPPNFKPPKNTGGLQSDASPTYYDLPLLKPPVWTWEVPLYFFVGGAAGAAAVVGAAAQLAGADRDLVRDARW